MTSRIEPVPATGNPPDVQDLLDQAAGAVGAPAFNIFRTLANHPGLMRRFLPWGGRMLGGSKLVPRDREVLILRTARLCASEYEWGQHARIGREVGLTDAEIEAIAAAEGDTAVLSLADRTLLRAAGELVGEHRLCDATWEALADRFDLRQLIEICFLVGNYAMIAGFLNSAGVELDEGVERFPQP